MRKGQLFSADAITAVAVFLLLLSAVMLARSSITNKINKSLVYETIEQKAELAADSIYKNMSMAAEFNQGNLIELFSKNYTQISDDYGIGFDYMLEVIDLKTRRPIQLNGIVLKKGSLQYSPTFSVTAERFGYLNGEKAELVMKVYYNE